jgi:hypothetical protein
MDEIVWGYERKKGEMYRLATDEEIAADNLRIALRRSAGNNVELASMIKDRYGKEVHVRPLKTREASTMGNTKACDEHYRKWSRSFGAYVLGFVVSLGKIADVSKEERKEFWLIAWNELRNGAGDFWYDHFYGEKCFRRADTQKHISKGQLTKNLFSALEELGVSESFDDEFDETY